MKKHIVSCFLAVVMPISGCGNSTEQSGNETTSQAQQEEQPAAHLLYENEDYMELRMFCGTDNGELFTVSGTEQLMLRHYDENGVMLSETEFPYNGAKDIIYANGSIYIAYTGYNEGYGSGVFVDKMEISTGAASVFCHIPQLSDIHGISFVGDELIAVGYDNSKSALKCGYMWAGMRSVASAAEEVEYGGTAIYSYADGEISEIVTDFPFEADSTGDKLVIYGCHSENGYYLRTYSGGELSEPVYTAQLGKIKGLAAFGDGSYVTQSSNRSHDMLLAGNASDDSAAEIFPNVFIGSSFREIKTAGDYCWIRNSESWVLERLRLSVYYKGNQQIKLLCSEYAYGYEPFSCGYNILQSIPDAEELALKVLSQDRDYDVCYVNSRDSIGGSLRDKGSFYPLNDVEGVGEYLDSLFPYLKEACITEDGEVWCIPVAVDGEVHFYNEENIAKTGYDLTDMDMAEYFDYVDYMKENGLSAKCCRNAWMLVQTAMLEYLAKHDSFDTEEFRSMAELIKTRFNIMNEDGSQSMTDIVHPSSAMQLEFLDNNIDSLYSDMSLLNIDGRGYFLWTDDTRAAPFPTYSEDEKNLVHVLFIAVNPASDNLDAALEYISDMTRYIRTQNDTFMLSDRTMYSDIPCAQDMYDIFSDGVVGYSYPAELYDADFKRYLSGQIFLDEYIAEADRKLSAYLNE